MHFKLADNACLTSAPTLRTIALIPSGWICIIQKSFNGELSKTATLNQYNSKFFLVATIYHFNPKCSVGYFSQILMVADGLAMSGGFVLIPASPVWYSPQHLSVLALFCNSNKDRIIFSNKTVFPRWLQQGKSEGLDSYDRPSNLTRIEFKFFSPSDLEFRWMTPPPPPPPPKKKKINK